jgi:hypothetical protein
MTPENSGKGEYHTSAGVKITDAGQDDPGAARKLSSLKRRIARVEHFESCWSLYGGHRGILLRVQTDFLLPVTLHRQCAAHHEENLRPDATVHHPSGQAQVGPAVVAQEKILLVPCGQVAV